MRYVKPLAVLMAASAMLASCDRQPAEPQAEVADAWVRLPAAEGRPGAAYFTLRTNNDPTRLIEVTSPAAERIELHETREENGVTRMVELEDTTFHPEARYEPGGKHAMLFGLDPALQPGGTITLTFRFDPAPPVTVEAELRAAGDAAPEQRHGH